MYVHGGAIVAILNVTEVNLVDVINLLGYVKLDMEIVALEYLSVVTCYRDVDILRNCEICYCCFCKTVVEYFYGRCKRCGTWYVPD